MTKKTEASLIYGRSLCFIPCLKPIDKLHIAPSMGVLSGTKVVNLRPIYKPHSVRQRVAWAIISLGGMLPYRSLRPTRDWRPPVGGCT
jgi:hypothetical protein